MNRQQKINIIALDLDGTLFNNSGQITAYTKDAIRKAVAKGVHVVISTGRPYIGLPVEELLDLGIEYAITCNGAALYEIKGKKCIYQVCMDNDHVADILNLLQMYSVYIDAFIEGEAYGERARKGFIPYFDMPETTKKYIQTNRIWVDDICDYVRNSDTPIQKITLQFMKNEAGEYVDHDYVEQVLKEQKDIVAVSGGYHNIEFTKEGTGKGNGLKKLAEYLSVPVTASMACGDSENDLDIMNTAGIGIAMENASTMVKSQADYVTKSNVMDGVGHAIYKFVLEESKGLTR